MSELRAPINGTEQRLELILAELRQLRELLVQWRDRAPTGIEQRLDLLIERSGTPPEAVELSAIRRGRKRS